MSYGIIENGIVVNSVEAETSSFAAEQGWVKLIGSAGIGWGYVGGKFTAPLAPALVIPDEVSAAQAKTALYKAGLYDAVETALGSSEYGLVRIWWSSAQIWRRDHPYILGLAAELGLTDDQVDNLFVSAAAVPT